MLQQSPDADTPSAAPAALTGGPRSLKERQRQEREALILAAAAELVNTKGYRAMSMDEIAAVVGVSKGTVYQHFPSKEDLMIALLQRHVQDVQRTLDDILNAPTSPRARLQRMLTIIYQRVASHRFRLFEAIDQNPELRRRLESQRANSQEFIEGIMRRIGELLDEGKAIGEIAPDLPTSVLLSLYASLLKSHSLTTMLAERQFTPEAMADYVGRIFFTGAAAPTPRASDTE
jgi:AcrR family transcriptional regulator